MIDQALELWRALLGANVWVLVGLGLVGLAIGGDSVIRGGVGVSRSLKLSPLFVGIVLLGFGTSLPELATSVESVRVGSPDVALGNVVGSNIANLLLIVGIAATLAVASVDRRLLWRNGLIMSASVGLLAAILAFNLLADRSQAPIIGAALIGLLVLYLISAMRMAGRNYTPPAALEDAGQPPKSAALSFGVFLFGLVITLLGATLLVEGSVTLAREAELPEALIGATIVAIGTSLPELAATVAAARRGKSNMAIGNVLGSNIFNSLAIVGVAALTGPLPTPPTMLQLDIWVMLLAAAGFMAVASYGGRITRPEGYLLLGGYALYLLLAAHLAL